MNDQTRPVDPIQDLEARHDDLLERLDALDRQIQQVLGEWTVKHSAAERPQP
jgi:hypothetical protein